MTPAGHASCAPSAVTVLVAALVVGAAPTAQARRSLPGAGELARPDSAAPAHDPWPLTPMERAVAGPSGVLRLAAPGPLQIKVGATRFRMGSTAGEVLLASAACARQPFGFACRDPATFAGEREVRWVSLDAYWLDRTEVRVADYQRCAALGRCRPLPADAGSRRFQQPAFPVTLVDHADAARYCAFRGGRLPSEAEWERAARGAARRTFPWGEVFQRRAANHGRLGWRRSDPSDGFRELAPVGSFPAGRTPEGFLDLAGNAAEWVADAYQPSFAPTPVANPVVAPGPATEGRVVRGGDWTTPASFLRGAARRAADADRRLPTVGFRCARSAAP